MEIIEYSQYNDKNLLLQYLKNCDWEAGALLHRFIVENILEEKMGESTKIFFAMEGNTPLAYITLSKYDCIDDKSISPWIGFVYTDTAHRGKGISQSMLKYAMAEAIKLGYNEIYLATDLIGFYEKVGFEFLYNTKDINGGDARLYKSQLKAESF